MLGEWTVLVKLMMLYRMICTLHRSHFWKMIGHIGGTHICSVSTPVTSSYGTVGRCQIELERKICISIKLVNILKQNVLLKHGYVDTIVKLSLSVDKHQQTTWPKSLCFVMSRVSTKPSITIIF